MLLPRRIVVPVLLVIFLTTTKAQFRTGNLQVRVTFTNGRPCNIRVRVQLMDSASTNPVAEGYTNDSGMIEFNNVEIGNYHLIISGQGIEETDSGMFEVDPRRLSQIQYVAVKRASSTEETATSAGGAPTVGAADLNIPENAAKEFDRATALMVKQDWKKAIERLNRALQIYPNYAAAYNNLGVIYARLGDREHEREALQKAISLNDHFAPAFVNLARMAIADHDLPNADILLGKASAADPTDVQTLILLANVELLERHYDLAIANCQKAHSLAKESHALAHYIAARAFEHENRPSEAIAELQAFLSEESSGDRAESVRRELAVLQARNR